jgi:Zn-dependent protease
MARRKYKLFRLLGFEISLDPSWAIIATLVVWSLSAGLFPAYYEGYSIATYWIMGAFATIGLFFSIVLHELAHSLVARRYGIDMKGITLFMFGGVSEMEEDPKTPKSEALMAAAGPATSVLLSLAFYGLLRLAAASGSPTPVNGVVAYLSVVNLVLAIFNSLPAYPLDGGRVFRSALWRWKGNLGWATRIAAGVGGAFGFVLMGLGLLQVLQGMLVGGLWWILIGFFLRAISKASQQQVLVQLALKNERVRRLMKSQIITVPSKTTLQEFVDNYVYRFRERVFPIVDGERLVGYVSTDLVKAVPTDEWSFRTVGQIGEHDIAEQTVEAGDEASGILHKLNKPGAQKLFVTEDEHLVGTISQRDLTEFLALKLDLQPQDQAH